jgi:hypothetical protein
MIVLLVNSRPLRQKTRDQCADTSRHAVRRSEKENGEMNDWRHPQPGLLTAIRLLIASSVLFTVCLAQDLPTVKPETVAYPQNI